MSKENKKTLSSYDLRSLGHCKKDIECKDKVYCMCDCLRCSKQDCLKPGCGKSKGCKKIHPYTY